MGTIQVKNVSFKYPAMVNNIFESLNLKIDAGWKLGLIGRNGRGKTTLLKILLGQLTYQGQITSDLNFYYYPQTIGNKKLPTRIVVQELSGLAEYDLWKIEVELEKLQLDIKILDQEFATLSPGERTKVLLAVMFADESGFQLLDEPTNHLDITGRQVVADYLRNKQGFIVISHDKAFLNSVIDHVISIDRQDVSIYRGNFDTWQTAIDQQNNLEQNQKKQLKNDIRRLHQTAVERKNWAQKSEAQNPDSTGKKMMKKSQTVAKRVNQKIIAKQALLKNIEVEAPLTLNYHPVLHHQTVLKVNNLSLQCDRITTPTISFEIEANQVVSLVGNNGIGKTTIFKQLLGIAQPFKQTGTIDFVKDIKISYLSQENELVGTIKQIATKRELEVELIYSNLRKLGFERALFDQPVEKMSQGQKQKVALAVSLSEEANLYLWDEPLNYLDVITRQQIIEVIERQHPTMLLVDHDQDLIETVANQVVRLENV
ncbi:ribosomal protection-like ABC-F family protein [Companilactobacillus muriivasis]|uniref:ribosomal protection-like ABC-F family protein n=1 Tax=Companilactobacillus muriivasis TaxID=3081444 RepID=UPI0030C68123